MANPGDSGTQDASDDNAGEQPAFPETEDAARTGAIPTDRDDAGHLPPPGTDEARDIERRTPPPRTRGSTQI